MDVHCIEDDKIYYFPDKNEVFDEKNFIEENKENDIDTIVILTDDEKSALTIPDGSDSDSLGLKEESENNESGEVFSSDGEFDLDINFEEQVLLESLDEYSLSDIPSDSDDDDLGDEIHADSFSLPDNVEINDDDENDDDMSDVLDISKKTSKMRVDDIYKKHTKGLL